MASAACIPSAIRSFSFICTEGFSCHYDQAHKLINAIKGKHVMPRHQSMHKLINAINASAAVSMVSSSIDCTSSSQANYIMQSPGYMASASCSISSFSFTCTEGFWYHDDQAHKLIHAIKGIHGLSSMRHPFCSTTLQTAHMPLKLVLLILRLHIKHLLCCNSDSDNAAMII